MAQTPQAKVNVVATNNTKSGLEQAANSVKKFAESTSNLLKGAFAAAVGGAIGEFFKSAITHAADAERHMADLAIAFRNTGANAAVAAPQVNKLVEALAEKTGFGKEEQLGAMSRLILLTGNYKTAMAGLPTVLDVAAARHIPLEQASTLVAKALNGNGTALKKLGVAVHEGETPFDALRRTFKGLAEQEGKTLAGTLNRLKNGYDELMVSIGEAITGNDSFSSTSNMLVDALKSVKQWVEANSNNISAYVGYLRIMAETVGVVIKTVLGMVGAVGDFVVSLTHAKSGSDLFVTVLHAIEKAIVATGAAFSGLGQMGKLAAGSLLYAFSFAIEKIVDLYNRIPFVHQIPTDNIKDWLDKSLTMMAEAQVEIDKINKGTTTKFAAIDKSDKPQKKTTIAPPPGGSDASMGAEDQKAQKEQDELFRKNVAGLKAQLDIADLRVNAQETLNTLAKHNLAIAEDSKQKEEDRIRAAERYGQIKAVLDADEKKQYDEAFNRQTSLLDLDDRRAGALAELVKLRDAELAIANDTKQLDDKRVAAQVRAKQVQDAINAADDKAFKERLALEADELKHSATRQDALEKLRAEMEAALIIANDEYASTERREESLRRIKAIIDATHGEVAPPNDSGHTGIFDAGLHEKWVAMRNDVTDYHAALADASDMLKGAFAESLAIAFQAMGAGGNVAKTFAQSMKKAIGEIAGAFGKYYVEHGVAKIAASGWPPNPAELQSGLRMIGAGAALSALAGTLGGGGGAGGSGGASQGGLNDSAKVAGNSKPDATLIIRGGLLDMSDARQADALANALGTLSGRRVIVMGS